MYSDASHAGYGGYVVDAINGVSHGMWSPDEALKSSTWRELTAVFRILCSLKHLLVHQRIKWFSDNQSVVAIVKKGSRKRYLQDLAIEIFNLSLATNIILEVEWVPRTDNERADYLSKIEDFDAWGISNELLALIVEKFGVPTMDWFASHYN